jgi:hypothetical protein
MHIIIVLLASVFCLWQGACQTVDGVNPFTSSAGNVRELPDNYADPDAPSLVPYYDISAEWEISPSSRTMLRKKNIPVGADPTYIWIDLPFLTDVPPTEARDASYGKNRCQPPETTTNPYINCRKDFIRDDLKIGGESVSHLRYWGTWQSIDHQVDEYFFTENGTTYMLTLENGSDEDRKTAARIIETLEFRNEIFVPGVEDEDLGGI